MQRVRADRSGMSDCILHLPQVYLRDLKNSYVGKKFEHRSDLVPSTRTNTDFPDHIWPVRNTDFEQNTLWFLWRPFSTLGRLHRFPDHGRTTRDLWGRPGHRYWPPHPQQQRFPLNFWTWAVQIPYCTVVTKCRHEKYHPQHPPGPKSLIFSFLQK